MRDVAPFKTLVIGDSSAIGRAIVAALLARGDTVVGVSRHPLRDEVPARYTRLAHDLLGGQTIAEFLAQHCARSGFHNLIYAAGFHRLQPLSPLSDGSLAEHQALNLAVMLDICRHFISPRYSDNGRQRSITLVASIAHRVAEPGLVAYSATKAAMVGAARAMAVEFAGRNIRVNTVSPGWIESEKAAEVRAMLTDESARAVLEAYPLGAGSASDVAHAVEFLSDARRARWITGTDLLVDGGRACR